jgi:tRNA A-37 threonylcarbamoyl transferase component Bud32
MSSYTKTNVKKSEYYIHNLIYNSDIVNIPKPYSYNIKTRTFTMYKINQMSISDKYGENFSDVPQHIIEEIRNIISTLYYNDIEYPDITGYNFIEYDNKIWIIDFEHASYKLNKKRYDPFILKFINGHNGWNSKFT